MSARPVVGVALAALLLATVAAGTLSSWNLVDDALILCRFAENVARGNGWAFNPGQPIESHSSPLWVVLLSVGDRLAMDLPYLSRALGVLAAVALVVLAAAAARALFPAGVALAVALLVAGDSALATWALSGLETAGFSALLLAGHLVLFATLRSGRRSMDLLLGGVAGALALVRPEGMLFGGLLVAVRLSAAGPAGRGVPALLVFALVSGALVAWRWNSFGSPLPGTLGAKWSPSTASMISGVAAVAHTLARRAPLVLGALATLPLLRREPDPALRRFALAAGTSVLLLVLLVVLAGGDWMGHDRLPGAALPLLALLLGVGLTLRGAAQRPPAPALFFLVALSLAGSWWGSDRIPEHGHAARRLGEWLARNAPRETRLGVAAAGAIPFHSGFVTVDALGITDAVVARTAPAPDAEWRPGHMRYDLERFLAERPDIIAWEFGAPWAKARMTEAAEGIPERRGDYRRELLRHPRFRAEYRPMPGVPAEAERYFSVFRRRGMGFPPSSGGTGGGPAPGDTLRGAPQRTP